MPSNINEILKQRISHNFPSMISHPSGWNDIVLRLHDKLMDVDPDYAVSQTKEKFGTLRFYASFSNQSKRVEAYQFIREAEVESARTCESCGRPGSLKVRPSGYRLTMCDDCYKAL